MCTDYEVDDVNPEDRPKRTWKIAEVDVKDLKIKRNMHWFVVNGKDIGLLKRAVMVVWVNVLNCYLFWRTLNP